MYDPHDGSEKKRRKAVAEKLRAMADEVESGEAEVEEVVVSESEAEPEKESSKKPESKSLFDRLGELLAERDWSEKP